MINYKEIKNLSCLLCGLKERLIWDYTKLDCAVYFEHTFDYDKSNHYDMISHRMRYSEEDYCKMIEIDILYVSKRYFLDIHFNENNFILGKILHKINDPYNFEHSDFTKFKFDLSDFNLDININSITNYVDSLICFQ